MRAGSLRVVLDKARISHLRTSRFFVPRLLQESALCRTRFGPVHSDSAGTKAARGNRRRFRKRHAKPEAREIKAIVAGWVTSIGDQLKDAEPSLPDELNDRQQDVIEPLFAIADVAGGVWPEAVRRAAIELFGSQAARSEHRSATAGRHPVNL